MVGRITFSFVLACACAGALAVGFLATTVEYLSPPRYRVTLGEAPPVTAAAWSVFDSETGEVLLAQNADTPLPIASIAKLAVAAAIYRSDTLFSTTTVTWSDVAAEGRAGSLAAGETYTRHALLFPLLLESSNDAAATLFRSDSTLVERMNAFADEKGLAMTHFADTSGISSANVSTAGELAALAHAIYAHERHLIDITALPYYASPERGWRNSSPFAGRSDYRGGKHGYTPAARHTAVALFEEELMGGSVRTIGFVVLRSDNLADDVAKLREYARTQVEYK